MQGVQLEDPPHAGAGDGLGDRRLGDALLPCGLGLRGPGEQGRREAWERLLTPLSMNASGSQPMTT